MSISARPPYATAFARRQRISRSTFCFRLLHGGNIAAFLVQLAIGFNYDNIIASVIVYSSASLMLGYLQFTNSFQERMISSYMLLGYCVTTHFGALLLQSASLTPLIEGLRVPLLTFSHLAGLQIIAILAHWVFRRVQPLNSASEFIGRKIIKPLGLFLIPSPLHLWTLGVIGFACNMAGVSAGGSVVGKTIEGMKFMAWAPFLIPIFASRYGKSYCDTKKQYTLLTLFIAGAVLLGMSLNYRGLMFIGPLTGALIFLVFAMSDTNPLGKFAYEKFAISLFIGALGIQAANYVVVAMVTIRNQIQESTKTEMISKTFAILVDPSRVEKAATAFDYDAAVGLFDEKYLSSPTLSRFVETKFNDNSFFYGYSLTDSGKYELLDVTIDKIISILPDPILKWLKIDLEKYGTSFYSGGDTLTYLSTGIPVGSFKSGSALAQGMSIFGYYFYAIYFLICMLIFVTYEGLARKIKNNQPEISSFVFLSMPAVFMHGLTNENLAGLITFVRTLPQSILLYAILYRLVRVFSAPYQSD